MLRYHNFVENPITANTHASHMNTTITKTHTPRWSMHVISSQPRNLNLQYAYDIQNQDEVLHKVQFTFLFKNRTVTNIDTILD